MSGINYSLDAAKDADILPFDPTGTDLVSQEVGPAIRELFNTAAVSASPGFTWGGSGNIKNAYLDNDSVPSNTSGRISPVTGEITTVFMTAENTSSAEVEIRRRVGAVFTTLVTVSYGGTRKVVSALGSPPAVSSGDELSVFINNTASAKNAVVGIIIKGAL